MKWYILAIFSVLLLILSCESTTSPSGIGGDTDIELTKVGNEFGVSLSIPGLNSGIHNIRDSVVIIKNDKGIVTFKGKFLTDIDTFNSLDTLMGTSHLSEDLKHQIVDGYLNKYNLNLDTSDKQNLTLNFEFKLKVTSTGIQDFVYSNGDVSKPFTIFKYSSKVGDKYEFSTSDGKKIIREVVSKNPDEDFDLLFWRIKTIRVEQLMVDDPVIKKVTFIGNHKFGLVGFIHELKDGRIIKTNITPWGVV